MKQANSNLNRALSPTRWCYQSTVYIAAFLNNYIFYKEKKALAFNRDRLCHVALCLRLILFHYSKLFVKTICKYPKWINFPSNYIRWVIKIKVFLNWLYFLLILSVKIILLHLYKNLLNFNISLSLFFVWPVRVIP